MLSNIILFSMLKAEKIQIGANKILKTRFFNEKKDIIEKQEKNEKNEENDSLLDNQI